MRFSTPRLAFLRLANRLVCRHGWSGLRRNSLDGTWTSSNERHAWIVHAEHWPVSKVQMMLLTAPASRRGRCIDLRDEEGIKALAEFARKHSPKQGGRK